MDKIGEAKSLNQIKNSTDDKTLLNIEKLVLSAVLVTNEPEKLTPLLDLVKDKKKIEDSVVRLIK